MLPEVLSNEICSLKPHEDRLAFSAVFELTAEGEIKNEWYGKTIIYSDKRFTYEEAQQILTDGQGLHIDELNTMNRLAKILRAQNKAAGAISFEDSEVKFKLDENNKPVDVIKKVRTDTNLLIEDFMLLANRKVAEYAHNKNNGKDHSFVYRIHDTPNIEKLQSLAVFLKPLGYDLQIDNDTISSLDLNKLLAKAEAAAESHIINRATVRAMAKAVYSTRNIGHWGLAFDYYTHFTSPIRRYPDLMVHRLLEIYLAGGTPTEKMITDISRQVVHSTDMEIRAADAERESIKFKQVEYMSTKIGQTFDGIVAGVTEFGLFVEDEYSKSEGMVRLSTLDDYYEFNEATLSLVGRASQNRIRLGDKIKIKLLKADVPKRQLDFEIVK
jgi:ribonuclease R